MNWSDETVESVALKIFDTYAASGIAADWAEGLNWYDVKRMAANSDAYAKVRDLCMAEAKASLAVVVECSEVKALVEAAKAVLPKDVFSECREFRNIRIALQPFTEASNG